MTQKEKILAVLKRNRMPFLGASCVHSNDFEKVASEIASELSDADRPGPEAKGEGSGRKIVKTKLNELA